VTGRRTAVVLFALVTISSPALGLETAEAVIARAEAAMSRGEIRDAIEAYEAFADQGGAHPDVSYDRGLAYVARVRSGQARPGDLGRAAAAFEEARLLRPDDPDAERALELVRSEVARRRARGGTSIDVTENQSAGRALVGLADEPTWAALALIASLVLTSGLLMRRRTAPRVRIAGGIAVALGGLALVTFCPLAFAARQLRRGTEPAVVVAEEARLADERGVPSSAPPLPEGARVDVLERRASLVRVRWGRVEGFTMLTSVRFLRRPG
jgi:hypothetical protein